jgi:hypothetical protein
MQILPEHRCPNCNAEVSVILAWESADKDVMGLMMNATGVVCHTCNTRLRIHQTRAGLVLVTVFATAAMIVVFAQNVGKEFGSVLGVLLIALLFVYKSDIARRFVTLRIRTGIATVDFPGEGVPIDSLTRDTTDLDPNGESKLFRLCGHCGEETPMLSRSCVRCGHYGDNVP